MEPRVLKSAQTDKLSGKGYLLYQIVYDSKFGICFEITANVINAKCKGKFSSELIPFSCIERLLNIQPRNSMYSKPLNSLFSSSSNNNAGFLASILRAEGLLKTKSVKGHLHLILQNNFSKWEQNIAISVKVVVAFVKNYADFLLVNLSGLRLTFGIQFQFRVSPLQRNGFTNFAI